MQLTHESSNVSCTVVTKKLLIEQSILLIIVQLKAPAFLATQDRAKGFINEPLRSDRQVLLAVVVKRDAMICVLEELNVLLQVLQIELFLCLVEEGLVGLYSLKACCLLFKIQNLTLSLLHA